MTPNPVLARLSLRAAYLVLFVAAFAASAVAQTDPALSVPLHGATLTEEQLTARITAVKNAKSIEDGIRTTLEALYGEATAAVRRAKTATDDLAKTQRLAAEAPRLLETERGTAQPVDIESLNQKATAELEAEFARVKALAISAAQQARDHEKSLMAQSLQQKSMPELIANAEKAVQTADSAAAAARDAEGNPLVVAARRTAANARQLSAQTERNALQAELGAFDLSKQLTTLRRDNAKAVEKHSLELAGRLQKILQERSDADAKRAETAARERLLQLQTANPLLQQTAQENLDSAKTRTNLQAELPRVRTAIDAAKERRTQIQERFDRVRETVRLTGLTQTNGAYLTQQKTRLPKLTEYRLRSKQGQDATAAIRNELMSIAASLSVDEEQFVEDVNARAPVGSNAADEAEATKLAKQLHAERTKVLTELRGAYEAKLNELVRQETEELQLTRVVQEFGAYIDEKVLWIRSSPPIWSPAYWTDERLKLRDLAGYSRKLATVATQSAVDHGPELGVGLLLLFALLGSRRFMRRRLTRYTEQVSNPRGTAFVPSVLALVPTVLLALPGPLLLYLAFLVLRDLDVVSAVGSGLAKACRGAAYGVFSLETMRELTRTGGVAEKHLGWNAPTVGILRRHLTALMILVVPAMFVVQACEGGSDVVRILVAQPVFIAGWLFMTLILANLFRPTNGLLGAGFGREVSNGTRRIVFLLAIVLPLTLVGLATYGYYLTSREIGSRFTVSLALVFALVLLNSLVERWQVVSHRKLAMEQRRKQAVARLQRIKNGEEAEDAAPPPEPELDVAEVSTQTKRLVRSVLLLVGLLSLFGIWSEVLPALGALRDVEIPGWSISNTVTETIRAEDGTKRVESHEEPVPMTLAKLLLFVLTIVMTIVGAKNIPGLLKMSILKGFRPGNQYAVATLTQYTIVLVGIVVAFAMIGIGWSKVQWLVAAVSLGLGFGLQEIFANFVSGLIILFEQPIRVGDFVTVGDVKGEVTRIRIRATTIRNLERQELIVPNKQFITGQVINWTLTDTINRIAILVGIAYGSDVDLARETLLRVADEHSLVVKEPRPKAIFKQFGDSSLNFELRVFIKNIDHWPKVVDQIHSAIDREFRAAGIEISFPQRDLHVRSVEGPIPFRHSGDPDQESESH